MSAKRMHLKAPGKSVSVSVGPKRTKIVVVLPTLILARQAPRAAYGRKTRLKKAKR